MPFRSIEDPAKLRRILEATLLIEAELDLPVLLRHIVEEARSMTNARYGALGVLNDDGTGLSEFVTAGLDPDAEARIGSRPAGRGILGRLISHPEPLRVAQLGEHPESFGMPPNHPPMGSFLGVPIRIRDEVYGNLYLTDKVGWPEFTHDDEALIGSLAIAAGIAIENARLHGKVREIAVYEERDRMARDLHDTVIQRLFAVGLFLQSIAAGPGGKPVGEQLGKAITDLDHTIRQVRTAIFDLGSRSLDQSLRVEVIALLRELSPVVGFEVRASFEGPVDTAVAEPVHGHLLAVVREAVTNIGKHADATAAEVQLTAAGSECVLQVTDNGKGMGAAGATTSGFGITNMRQRAEKLHGDFDVSRSEAGGTILTWRVPLDG